jgi:hypothetical protein
VLQTHATEYRVMRSFGMPFGRIQSLGDLPTTVFDDGQG